jgi:hypothetical protein
MNEVLFYTGGMTTILLILTLIALFVVGLVSPHLAGKIQRKTDEEAGWLKRLSNWFWDPITYWVKKSIEFNRKAIDKVATLGKKTRRKL